MRARFPRSLLKATVGRGHTFRTGATLIEIALVIMIMGVSVVALMEFFASATKANFQISDHARGVSVARAAHEWAVRQNWTDLMGHFASGNFTPAGLLHGDTQVGATGTTYLPDTDTERAREFSGWTEVLSMRRLVETNLSTIDTDPNGPVAEITVSVFKNGERQFTLSKLYVKPD